MSLSHCIHQTLNSKASTRFHSGGLQQSLTLFLNTFLFGVIILIANILKRAFSSQLAAKLRNRDRKSGSAGMPRPISYAVFCLKKKNISPQSRFVHQDKTSSYVLDTSFAVQL